MSSGVSRPPRVTFGTRTGSRPSSARSLRTAGEKELFAFASEAPSVVAAARADVRDCVPPSPGREDSPALSKPEGESVSMLPSRSPGRTVSPAAFSPACRTPDAGAGISNVTLSVLISTKGSFSVTRSPARFSHEPTVASVPSRSSCGILISTIGTCFPFVQKSSVALICRAIAPTVGRTASSSGTL